VRQADHSSRGVLPTVVRRCVRYKNLVNVEALAQWGTVAPKTKTIQYKAINSRNVDTFQTGFCLFVQREIKCRYQAHLDKLTYIDLTL